MTVPFFSTNSLLGTKAFLLVHCVVKTKILFLKTAGWTLAMDDGLACRLENSRTAQMSISQSL
jgi:hypothetical protein